MFIYIFTDTVIRINRILSRAYFKSRNPSRLGKLKIQKSIKHPTVTYSAETWALTIAEQNRLQKTLRKIYGLRNNGRKWRISRNIEIEELYNELHAIGIIRCRKLNIWSVRAQ